MPPKAVIASLHAQGAFKDNLFMSEKKQHVEAWDLVLIYSNAFKRKEHFTCVCIGYQLLEYILIMKMTCFQNINGKATPPSKNKLRKASYLASKAELAFKLNYINEDTLSDIRKFNKLRANIIHNMIEKNVHPEDVIECSSLVLPTYGKIQGENFWKAGDVFVPKAKY
jgi:hypothetical protein